MTDVRRHGAEEEGSLSVTWTAPMTGPVINYNATLATEGQADTSVSTGTNLLHNFTGLTPGTRYTVRIRAETRKETNVELGTVGATSDAFPFYTSAFFVCFFVLVCVSLSLSAFFLSLS